MILTDEKVMYYLPDIKTQSFPQSKANPLKSIEEINSPIRMLYFFRIEQLYTAAHVGEIG
jgi:ribosomal-protein-alanine N-acetyltransferase